MSLHSAGKLALIDMMKLRGNFTHGNLRSYTTWMGPGSLPHEHREEARLASYWIYSYTTPVAWYESGQWKVPNIRYSSTTSDHQSNVRQIASRLEDGTLDEHEQFLLRSRRSNVERVLFGPSTWSYVAPRIPKKTADEHDDFPHEHDGSGYVPDTFNKCLACQLLQPA